MDLIDPAIRAEINSRLDAIERKHGIRILYAAEAGSRSWGFASPTSDYDVRFIYVPTDWRRYLMLEPFPEVISLPPEGMWDFEGWDLRKTLRLLAKGNPSLAQRLYSPIVYRDNPAFLGNMRTLLAYAVPRAKLYWSYRSIALSHLSRGVQGRDEVSFKILLYVVQAILAMKWTETSEELPPVLFAELVEKTVGGTENESLRIEIESLARMKSTAATQEQSASKRLFPNILRFIERSLEETQPPVAGETTLSPSQLDGFLLSTLGLVGRSENAPQ